MENDPLKISGMHDDAASEIFRNAQKLRANLTVAESLLWEYLKTKPLGFKFRRQHPINNYVLDFYCHRKRISIEIDGGYHSTSEQKAKDIERTKTIENLGIQEM